jgi:enamine deaminase RidA (YjgF/YER057c/UK114 family)
VLRWLSIVLAISLAASGWAAKKKKKSDDDTGMLPVISEDKKKKKKSDEAMTQTLPPPKEAPSAVAAEADRLVFQVSPLSAKGLLSQQTREALRSLLRTSNGATIVKLRAFVAGSGDMRRIAEIAAEVFGEKHQGLPALSVVQAGALPLEAAQVVMESVAVDKRVTNPKGIAFISGQAGASLTESLSKLKNALTAVNLESIDVLRVTCFVSLLDEHPGARAEMETAFHGAALNYIQMQREPVTPVAECEAVARLRAAPVTDIAFLNPEKSTTYSQVAMVTNSATLIFTGAQLGFGGQEYDIKLAFERLKRALISNHARFDHVAMSSVYVTSRAVADKVRAVRTGYYSPEHPPASTLLPFEGLPSLDASFGIDLVAPQETGAALTQWVEKPWLARNLQLTGPRP